jgi:feruloyl esterase
VVLLKSANDLCLVKLMVGPGHAGPAGAPSTSKGIGIEVWLPAPGNWNGRIHAFGGGGWQGGMHGSPEAIVFPMGAAVAGAEGAVVSQTDTGHGGIADLNESMRSGSFAMKPDGSVNEVLWKDFASRAIDEQAVKTRALATAWYGAPPRYAW